MKTITPGRRPTIEEVCAYYARPEVLNEILQAMQCWHARFVPGYARQSWVYTKDPDELRSLLRQPLDLMAQDPERSEYPYFRINGARYSPAHSWDEDKLWGYDFVIEKDSFLWQECFEAMLPVMDILEYFGVHYWLKYTGHHSLHLIIPAECFPRTIGPNDIPLTEVHETVYHRLMVFLNKRARQHYNEHDRHCPPGTNMPYSLNEDTGLVNTPLLRKELMTFSPWHANIHLVQVQDFWRTVPELARGCAKELLDEVLKPFEAQARFYPPDVVPSRTERSEVKSRNLLKLSAGGPQPRNRLRGGYTLPIQNDDVEKAPDKNGLRPLIADLADEDANIRWLAAEVLARLGPREALPALLDIPYDDMASACLVDFCDWHGEATIPVLIEALKTFEHPWSSPPVDKALQRMGQASVPYLETLLDDPNPNARKQATIVLERIAGTPTLDSILTLSTQQNRKHDAARMLGWYDDSRAHQRLMELAQEPHNARARRNAIKALMWTDNPNAEQIFQHALNDEHDKVRRWAARGLQILETWRKIQD